MLFENIAFSVHIAEKYYLIPELKFDINARSSHR